MGSVQEVQEISSEELKEKCLEVLKKEGYFFVYALKDGHAEVIGYHNGYTIFKIKGPAAAFLEPEYAEDFFEEIGL